MQQADASKLSTALVMTLGPYCERIAVAGSLRRAKAEVKDIEIVAIPRWLNVSRKAGLFVEYQPTNLLHDFCTSRQFTDGQVEECPKVQWIKTGTSEIVPWKIEPKGKYWRGYLPDQDIKLDLFLCSELSWGGIFLIRTGSADFSQAVMTHAKRRGMRFEGGILYGTDKQPIITREEADVFKALGLPYLEPEKRTGPLRRIQSPD